MQVQKITTLCARVPNTTHTRTSSQNNTVLDAEVPANSTTRLRNEGRSTPPSKTLNFVIMAKAIFHSIRGEKKTTALVLVKKNAFVFSSDPAYVPANALPEGIKPGESFDIPDGYQLVDFVVNGETRHTKDGVALKTLAY